MADPVSDDRATEVLAGVLTKEMARLGDWSAAAPGMANRLVEALAGAGFQITDLRPEELRLTPGEAVALLANAGYQHEDYESAVAKLRALASSSSGEETRET